jgi:phosphoribosylanthranilate isomerase
MGVRVKICGITNLEDAILAVEAGADAVGFVFCDSSPRYVSGDAVARITAALPPFVTKVGLFVNAAENTIREAVAQCGLDALQLHGDEPPQFCARFQLHVIKAFRVRDRSSLAGLPLYKVAAWLLDSYVPGKLGGTGERFSWELACEAAQLGRPVILAGGLTPANVADAVQLVRPYAVDVSSGVESQPGKKDAQKLRDFIQIAKSAV